MERPNAWKKYDEAALAELDDLCERYRAFISDNKTERECVTASIKLAEAAGYTNLADAVEQGRELKAGDKVYARQPQQDPYACQPGQPSHGAGHEHPGRPHRLPAPGPQAEPALRGRRHGLPGTPITTAA